MTIYDIPAIVNTAFPLACTINNIKSGFLKTGIWPFNRNIFTEEDVLPAYSTDRPEPVGLGLNREDVATIRPVKPGASSDFGADLLVEDRPSPERLLPNPDGRPHNQEGFFISEKHLQEAGCSKDSMPFPPTSPTENRAESITSLSMVRPTPTPEDVRPFKKAGPRKLIGKQGRKKGKSTILTDSPVLKALKEDKQAAKRKKEELEARKRDRENKKLSITNIYVKKNLFPQAKRYKMAQGKKDRGLDSSEDEGCFCLVCIEDFSKSKPNEKWVQCTKCKSWAHEKCTHGSILFYICLNCNSDDEID